MLFHTDLPKIDNRMGGTPDHNKAIAQGFVAMYGSYPVDEANKTIIVKFAGGVQQSERGACLPHQPRLHAG